MGNLPLILLKYGKGYNLLFLKKCWDWCVKHWKLLLAFLGGIIVFVLGYTRGNKESRGSKLKADLAKKEVDTIFHAKNKRNDAVHSVLKDREGAFDKLAKSQEDIRLRIDKKKKDFKENLTQDDIDNFLKGKGIDKE